MGEVIPYDVPGDIPASDLPEEIKEMAKDIVKLKVFLRDAYASKDVVPLEQRVEKKVRNAIYEVEDLIDSYLAKTAAAAKKRSKIDTTISIPRDLLPPAVFADQTMPMRESLLEPLLEAYLPIYQERLASEKLHPWESEQTEAASTEEPPMPENIVGLKGLTDDLIKGVSGESDKVEVICITGMKGLGKTTLAAKIFHDQRIKDDKFKVIWVNATQGLNKRDVFLAILKKLLSDEDVSKITVDEGVDGTVQEHTKDMGSTSKLTSDEDESKKTVDELDRTVRDHMKDMSHMTDDKLDQAVRDRMEREKYLMIIDDVWSVEAWKELQSALPMDNKHGRILITTWDQNVAFLASTRGMPIKLEFMEENIGWDLLKLIVYDKQDYNTIDAESEKHGKSVVKVNEGKPDYTVDPESERLGRSVVKQCGGLPRVLVQVGKYLQRLSGPPTTGEAVSTHIWKIATDIFQRRHFGLLDLSYEYSTSLWYHKLPYDLRDCLVYMGVFPDDAEIPVWKLTQLWIAEGLVVQGEASRTLENVAEDNLMELIRRNFVLVGTIKPNGKVKTCRLHSSVRRFFKREGHENNVFHEITKSKNGVFEPLVSRMKKYRRLCMDSHVAEFLAEKPDLPKTRSFLCFPKEPIIMEDKQIETIVNGFNKLRVFEASSSTLSFPNFPTKLTRLLLLKYIALSGDKLNVLPKSISECPHIRTIIINTSSPTLKIEANIWEMSQLRLFKTKAAIILRKRGKGNGGKNLQKLTMLSPENCTDRVSDKASNLKALGIRGQLADLLKSSFLGKLELLVKLNLVNETSGVPLTLPAREKFPPKLQALTLSATFLNWGNMSTLGSLVGLTELKLKDNAFVGESWNTATGGFRSLLIFHIECADLKKWTASADSFPELTFLVVKNCHKLEGVPFELKEKLQKLETEGTRKSAPQIVGNGTDHQEPDTEEASTSIVPVPDDLETVGQAKEKTAPQIVGNGTDRQELDTEGASTSIVPVADDQETVVQAEEKTAPQIVGTGTDCQELDTEGASTSKFPVADDQETVVQAKEKTAPQIVGNGTDLQEPDTEGASTSIVPVSDDQETVVGQAKEKTAPQIVGNGTDLQEPDTEGASTSIIPVADDQETVGQAKEKTSRDVILTYGRPIPPHLLLP